MFRSFLQMFWIIYSMQTYNELTVKQGHGMSYPPFLVLIVNDLPVNFLAITKIDSTLAVR